VNVDQAEALLGELAASISGRQVEIGTRGRPPHNYAYLKLTLPRDAAVYAVVSTPGMRWFELEIAGGFYTGRADDLASDESVREYVEQYLRAAISYLEGHWSTGKSGLFRSPFIAVQTDDGELRLRLSRRKAFEALPNL
jgi:hypothetical protein